MTRALWTMAVGSAVGFCLASLLGAVLIDPARLPGALVAFVLSLVSAGLWLVVEVRRGA